MMKRLQMAWENSAFAEVLRHMRDMARLWWWRIRCLLGWHEWTHTSTLHWLSILAPLERMERDVCIYCHYERHGSRTYTPLTPRKTVDADAPQ